MLDKLTREDFEKHLNQKFTVRAECFEQEMELTNVSPLMADKTHDLPRDPFSIHFKSPENHNAVQQIYKVTNEAMGELDLFLVPIDACRLEAVFT